MPKLNDKEIKDIELVNVVNTSTGHQIEGGVDLIKNSPDEEETSTEHDEQEPTSTAQVNDDLSDEHEAIVGHVDEEAEDEDVDEGTEMESPINTETITMQPHNVQSDRDHLIDDTPKIKNIKYTKDFGNSHELLKAVSDIVRLKKKQGKNENGSWKVHYEHPTFI